MPNEGVNASGSRAIPNDGPYAASLQDVENLAEGFRTVMESSSDNLRLVGTMPVLGGAAGAYSQTLMNNLASAFALSRALYQDLLTYAERMKEDGQSTNQN